MASRILSRPAVLSLTAGSAGVFEPFRLALAAWRQRRSLAALDAHRLEDLGISPADALREAGRPIWDVPANWRA